MSIARHDQRMQINCDACPAAYPNTYAEEDFRVMVADAKAAGWIVRKIPAAGAAGHDRDTSDLFGKPPRIAGGAKAQSYTHTCPSCASADRRGSLI
ncbi:hypothetical protein D5400_12475 [Georhizobium profundi]|uniref:Uncharacterized protein n=1 Tax=Georhizobium profundi TaxID=2341112 RepID=A0A3Q8XP82_9HYPH|nr:hypothetical protein [Georhizobium profundi]AZN71981.1 hypothetical protein D5400_12475 [Georhizobium profundi]